MTMIPPNTGLQRSSCPGGSSRNAATAATTDEMPGATATNSTLQLGRGIENLRLKSADSMFGPYESAGVTSLCRAMTHLSTQEFSDNVIHICNHVSSLALNEIDSLCAGLQRTSIDEEKSVGTEISTLSVQIRHLELRDLKAVVSDLTNKLQNVRFHDYSYANFISINKLLTKLCASFLHEQLNKALSELQVSDPAFEEQYELTCRLIRYILTSSPPEGRVLSSYLQQLRVPNCGGAPHEYF